MTLRMLVALSRLHPDDRAALIDHELCGRSFDQIAKELGVSRERARQRRDRAIRQLAPLLEATALKDAA